MFKDAHIRLEHGWKFAESPRIKLFGIQIMIDLAWCDRISINNTKIDIKKLRLE